MSDDATPRLGLPYLAAAQAQKHVTLNEALSALDGLVQTAVVSRRLAAEPAAPADGALYLLPAGASGADWAGRPAGALMRFEAGAWTQVAAPPGALAYVVEEGVLALYDGAAWRDAATAIHALQNLSLLGVGTTADATNPLAVKAPAVLVDNTGHGVQLKVNKATAADVGSVLFQTGYAARAEAGLVGDDQFHLRVADDGGTWRDALVIDRPTGRVSLPLPALGRYAAAALPSPAQGAAAIVTDDPSGPVLACADGTAWRRVADGTTIPATRTINGPWTPYTVTVYPTTGAFGAAVASGRYRLFGKTCFLWVRLQISDNGTGGTSVNFNLPAVPSGAPQMMFGRERAVNGNIFCASIEPGFIASASCTNFNNSYPGVNGVDLVVAGTYEIS